MTLRSSRVVDHARNECQALPFTMEACTMSGILKGEILLVGIQDWGPCR